MASKKTPRKAPSKAKKRARKAAKKPAKRPPSKTAKNGGSPGKKGDRDPRTGQFAPGNPGGPGRPRGIDFRELVLRMRGATVEQSLVAVFDRLVQLATVKADVQAARLLLDRLCDRDALKVDFGASFDELLRRALELDGES
jgi:hypothetical protein